jgi:hypothetical protein
MPTLERCTTNDERCALALVVAWRMRTVRRIGAVAGRRFYWTREQYLVDWRGANRGICGVAAWVRVRVGSGGGVAARPGSAVQMSAGGRRWRGSRCLQVVPAGGLCRMVLAHAVCPDVCGRSLARKRGERVASRCLRVALAWIQSPAGRGARRSRERDGVQMSAGTVERRSVSRCLRVRERDGPQSIKPRATRALPGSRQLRALVVFDEVYGLLPPHPSNPPTKRPTGGVSSGTMHC